MMDPTVQRTRTERRLHNAMMSSTTNTSVASSNSAKPGKLVSPWENIDFSGGVAGQTVNLSAANKPGKGNKPKPSRTNRNNVPNPLKGSVVLAPARRRRKPV